MARVQPELRPESKIKAISEDKRNIRMKNFLLSAEKSDEATVSAGYHVTLVQ